MRDRSRDERDPDRVILRHIPHPRQVRDLIAGEEGVGLVDIHTHMATATSGP
ncbi:MAG TPA: hypothetical protein VF062_03015 [Candidatus Limnocylindrales bacterium]